MYVNRFIKLLYLMINVASTSVSVVTNETVLFRRMFFVLLTMVKQQESIWLVIDLFPLCQLPVDS